MFRGHPKRLWSNARIITYGYACLAAGLAIGWALLLSIGCTAVLPGLPKGLGVTDDGRLILKAGVFRDPECIADGPYEWCAIFTVDGDFVWEPLEEAGDSDGVRSSSKEGGHD